VSGQRKALIIANDMYEQEALGNLLAPAADAEALRRVLGDPQIGDFAVQVVQNQASSVIEEQIEDLFSESRPDDVLLLHFSGHGLKSDSGELFFASSNTRPNRLGSTAVSADFVQRCMRDARSRSVVLLLDCCYGGAFAQGVKVRAAGDVNVLDSFPPGRSGGGRGRAVITASNAMEYAFEGDRLANDQQRRPSVFTGALVEGLATGDADRDEDGLVSLNELYDYVFDKVREQNPHQRPSRQIEMEGELYLACSRRERIRPAPIPPDLQAAITDPNMYTRRGAVSELQSRMASEDLPVAAGAYEALAGLARNDIQFVAEVAAAALDQAAVRPEETELHFGRVERGSASPHRVVRLLGPPIARACVPHPLSGWIRVDQTADGLDISIDTAGSGLLRGSLDLKGPAGEGAIAIDVDLVPSPATPAPLLRRWPISAAIVAACLALACALSIPLQWHDIGSFYAGYEWFLSLAGLALVGAAAVTFIGKSKAPGAGMIVGVALTSGASVLAATDWGGTLLVAGEVVMLLTALAAAGIAVSYLALTHRLTRSDVRPLVAAFCAMAIGFAFAAIPDPLHGISWVHGSGAHGWHIFGGIVVVVALVTAGATAAVLAPHTGARAGVVTGWLLVCGADLLWIRLLPSGRATPALYVLCVLWLCALAIGIPLLIGDLPRRAGRFNAVGSP
jgi:Caspase domain